LREAGNTPKVLLVDDEPVIADTLAVILRSHGYRTAAAYSGESALVFAPEFRPDVLITDLNMPGTNGIVLAAQVREMYPSCRILLYTSQTGIQALLEQARAGGLVLELLPKPVHPAEIIKYLAKLEPDTPPTAAA
jgi:CheY-like chemotaxis protein